MTKPPTGHKANPCSSEFPIQRIQNSFSAAQRTLDTRTRDPRSAGLPVTAFLEARFGRLWAAHGVKGLANEPPDRGENRARAPICGIAASRCCKKLAPSTDALDTQNECVADISLAEAHQPDIQGLLLVSAQPAAALDQPSINHPKI